MTGALDIDTRQGLPAHLRVLADLYPRPIWHEHPNFNDLTAFWLDRHVMFRKVLEKISGETERFLDRRADDRFGPELARYTGFFLNQLHGHHTIEDEHYFPQFAGLDARLGKAFELLDRDHHRLDKEIQALAEATNALLAALGQGDARAAAGRLAERHRRFHTFLNRHLSDEEEVIVPLVLEYGAGMK